MDREARRRIRQTLQKGATNGAALPPVAATPTHDYRAEAAEVNARRLRDEVAEMRALTARLAVVHENVARISKLMADSAESIAASSPPSVIAESLAADAEAERVARSARSGVRHIAG